MAKTPKVLFTDSSRSFILSALGYKSIKGGQLVRKDNGEPALCKNGDTIKVKQFAGVYKEDGVDIFIKGDLRSIMDFVDDIK